MGGADAEVPVGAAQRVRVGQQAGAGPAQTGPHLIHLALVHDGRCVLHRGAHLVRQAVGIATAPVEVGEDLVHAQFHEAGAGPDRVRGRRPDVEHRAPRGGGVRQDRGDDAGRVGVDGGVHHQRVAGGHRLDGVLLGGREVADPALLPRVAVAGVGRGQGDREGAHGVLIAGEGPHEGRVREAVEVLEVPQQRRRGVLEDAENQFVAHLDAVEDADPFPQQRERHRRGEPV